MRIIYNVIVDDYAALTIEGGNLFQSQQNRWLHIQQKAQNTFLSVPYNSGNTAIAVQADTTNSTSSGIVNDEFRPLNG